MGRKTIKWKRRVRTVASVPTPTYTATATSITLKWTAVTGATRYDLQKLSADELSWTTVFSSPTALTYTDPNLNNSASYVYRLAVATVSGSTKLSSGVAAATVDVNAPPAAPTFEPTITNIGTTAIEGEVDAVPGATRYIIQRLALDA